MSEEKKVNRRDYLKYTGAVIGGLVVGGALGYVLKPKEVIEKTATVTIPGAEKTVTVTGPGVTITETITPPLKAKYTFYFVSHIGPGDPNMNWLTKGIEEISKCIPVKVNYVSAPRAAATTEEMVRMVESAIVAKPDGIIVPILDPSALNEPLRRAIDMGIPVVASNISDPRPPEEAIPYLTYFGGNEYLTGYRVNKRALELLAPWKPKHSIVAITHPGHVGHMMRAKGMEDLYKELGLSFEKVALDPEPAKCYELARAYLEAHPETELIFITAAYWSPYIAKAITDLGLKGKIKLTLVDESPISIEGIRRGEVIATHSQGFWYQGYLPPFWLYMYHEYKHVPIVRDLFTGPIVIDKTNVEIWKNIVRTVFGPETYDKLAVPIYP
jgi:simple sugar transport system substrate-binding protein